MNPEPSLIEILGVSVIIGLSLFAGLALIDRIAIILKTFSKKK